MKASIESIVEIYQRACYCKVESIEEPWSFERRIKSFEKSIRKSEWDRMMEIGDILYNEIRQHNDVVDEIWDFRAWLCCELEGRNEKVDTKGAVKDTPNKEEFDIGDVLGIERNKAT